MRVAEAPVEQPGQAVRLPRRRDDPRCPAQASERWLQRSGISYGPVFRAVTVHGILERRLGVVSLRRILQEMRGGQPLRRCRKGASRPEALGAR